MNNIVKKAGITLLLACGISSLTLALPADFMEKMQARPAEDQVRDAARHPAEVLTLLGLKEGWTVVDVSAGGGWYTRVLSAAVGPKGKVISQYGARPLQTNNGQAQKDLAAQLGNNEPFFGETEEIPAGSADAAITALNLHDAVNFRGEESGIAFIKGMYDVLKSGGVAAIIDHAGTVGADNKTLHRVPAVEVRAMIEKVGFKVVAESDILHVASDDHHLGSHDESLGRNTDRFLFIVKKP